MSAPKKTGRPRKNEVEREKLTKITFLADDDTLAALEELQQGTVTRHPHSRRSAIIRLAIQSAARQIRR